MSVLGSKVFVLSSSERMFKTAKKLFLRFMPRFDDRENGTLTVAEINTTDSARLDLGLGICFISGKNLVLEILSVKTRKINIFISNFRRFDNTVPNDRNS